VSIIVVRFSYYVRVVSTEQKTTVTWDTPSGTTSGSKVLSRAEFTQIYNPLASQPMRIICDKPCLVMQYNPGLSLFIKLYQQQQQQYYYYTTTTTTTI